VPDLYIYGLPVRHELFLQQVQHYSPSLTGVALLPAFGCALLATSLSGRLMARIGARSVMVIGLILNASGCFGMVLIQAHISYMLLACLLAVLGGGLALVLPAMTEAAISHASQTQAGIASGMLNVSRQVGGVLGVAILGALVGNPQTFLSGMHLAFVIAGGMLMLGLIAAWVFVSEHSRQLSHVERIEHPCKITNRAEGAVGRREQAER
jgi:DHA2 family methylenomycin A resistance protein-like MFS transporter